MDYGNGMCARSRRQWLTLALVGAALMLAAQGCVFVYVGRWIQLKTAYEEKQVQPAEHWYTSNKVLLLNIDGVILDAELSSLFFSVESTVASVKERLRKAERDPHIRAVILRLNSPGGGVTASDIIYHELQDFKVKTGIPVVACIMDVGASGAYYVAMASDRIVAHPTAVTGSIGVVMNYLTFDGLMKKFGVADVTIKSGKQKDMGSPFRAATDQDREIFQATIDEMYGRFVDIVAKNRKNLDIAKIRQLADGRIYTAQQAKQHGLIDDVGYIKDAFAIAKERANIADASIVTYKRSYEYRDNVYSQSQGHEPTGRAGGINIDLGALRQRNMPVFMYLWEPGR